MVFGATLLQRRPPPEMSPETAASPWSKEDVSKLDFMPETPETVPETKNELESDAEDWDWDLVGDAPAAGSVGNLVIDDYLVDPFPKEAMLDVQGLEGGEKEEASHFTAIEIASKEEDVESAEVSSHQATSPLERSVESIPGAAASMQEELSAEEAVAEKVACVRDADSYLCLGCDNKIFSENDILSSNYHAMTGPGYFVGACRNIAISEETQSAVYTTGRYTIREVTCECCGASLGVTYTSASNPQYEYKVGKFLVDRNHLLLPPGVSHPKDPPKD